MARAVRAALCFALAAGSLPAGEGRPPGVSFAGLAPLGASRGSSSAEGVADGPALLAAAPGGQGAAERAPTPPPEAWPEYRIRTGDVLTISIPFDPSSQMQVPVRPDGRITYLFGIETMAAGRTYRELRDALRKELATYYRVPRVTVVGKSFAGNSVFVMGPVKTPGRHTIQNDTRLLDVLASAGVLSLQPTVERLGGTESFIGDIVDLENAYIIRRNQDLGVDFRNLLFERDFSQNIRLQPGDFIFIPGSLDTDKKIFVCGRVNRPMIHRFSGDITFLEAILAAGGTDSDRAAGQLLAADSAKNRHCLIIRKGQTRPLVADYAAIQMGEKPDIALQSGDIVYVPERGLSYTSRVTTNVIHEIIAPLQAVLNGQSVLRDAGTRDWSLH